MNKLAALRRKLRARLGPDAVRTAPGDLDAVAGDKWFAARRPDIAVFPASTEEASAVLALSHAAGVPVTARGAGYGYVGGCVAQTGGIVLSTMRMNRILEIDSRDFVARVQPGALTGDIQARARRKGLLYPPDPASLKDCSIGGNIATNAGGPRCLKYGVTRNYVLGLEVVLADGVVVRLGGRTHKNKTGFDLIGMFVGSEGLLGVVTEATLRLLPHPPARAALSAGFPTMRMAAAAVQAVFRNGYLPAAVEVADRFTLDAGRRAMPDANIPPGHAHVLIELDGQPASVRGETKDLARVLSEARATRVDVALDEASCDRLWQLRRGFSDALRATGLTKLNEDVVVPRARLVDLVEFARRLEKESGFPVACFGHAGDGNIHVNVMAADYGNPQVRADVERVLDRLFAKVLEWGGAITGEHGIGLAKLRWWNDALSSENRALHATIKRALDPRGLLNPGKFV
ncbi:MAG: FAD-linked oxidase C-terminal domain-containing protein [Terrimicrobiaceae bacterium]|nr:FAD-linked oxidase C-terminal domain-containing protein [Terrimicrobiaceae bacterium]